ncbi:MAG: hypothetical protein Ct9H300mP19_13210 [Dehalococcoidia bacterium]|nr:MAG: hypothetical protein Ct9H300mP19_13210 [Dehalococcoidia bacterium]
MVFGRKSKGEIQCPVISGETVKIYGKITDITKTNVGLIATCSIGCEKPDGTDAVVGQATVPLE